MNARCQECERFAVYNVATKKGRPLYCRHHKHDTMVDVIHVCRYNECVETAVSNYPRNKHRLYCETHALPGMVRHDSKIPCYGEQSCRTAPSFNFPGSTVRRYCKRHALQGMINVTVSCRSPGCRTTASYNFPNCRGVRYCRTHATEGMTNVTKVLCKTPLCETQISNHRYEGMCLRCFMYTYPNRPVSKSYKTKEYSVVEHVQRCFPELDWIHDRVIPGGESKRRPDLYVDLSDRVVVVEIDENMHRDYECPCENKRLMEISLDVKHRPLVFVRFNPDQYYTCDGTSVPSCWGTDNNGLPAIKRCKRDEWNERLNVLNETLRYWTDPAHVPDRTVELLHLFYDEAPGTTSSSRTDRQERRLSVTGS